MDLKDVERLIKSDNKEGFLGIVHFGYRSLLCNLCIKVNGVTYSRAVAQIFIESMTEFCQITVNSIFRRIAAYDGPSVNSPPIAQKALGIAFAGEAVPFNPVPNITTSTLTKGQKRRIVKNQFGSWLDNRRHFNSARRSSIYCGGYSNVYGRIDVRCR